MKMGFPRAVLAAFLLVLGVTIAAGTNARSGASSLRPVYPPLTQCTKLVKSEVIAKGKLTIATDSPALAPWFASNDPANQKGYESAVAYNIAATLGLKASQVRWYSEPYWKSQAAGKKPFDFDINEIIYNPKVATRVSFSQGYFNVNQSIVAIKGNPVIARHSPTELKTYLYGDVKGSPGLAFINAKIVPTRAPIVYSSLALAIAALESKKIDAIVVDTPSGQYIAHQQLSDGVQVAQFQTTTEHYALVFQHSNPLRKCVNAALNHLSKRGILSALSKKYLSIYNSVRVIKP